MNPLFDPFWRAPGLLVLTVPPLIWGWLTYRVFAFDALWFAHHVLDCLQALRDAESPANLFSTSLSPFDLLPPALSGAPDQRPLNNPALPPWGDAPKPT